MRRGLVSAAVVLTLMGTTVGSGLAQQQPEFTAVTIEQGDAPGWWTMTIHESEGGTATWAVRVGDGCEQAQPGWAGLLVDGTRNTWMVLPDQTGVCHIEESNLVDHEGDY